MGKISAKSHFQKVAKSLFLIRPEYLPLFGWLCPTCLAGPGILKLSVNSSIDLSRYYHCDDPLQISR